MKTKCLEIGISTISMIILILASLTNVVGYQSVQTSQQDIIKERINQRELLFQTIVDIANNKEIQRIIQKSLMGKGIFPTSEFPVVTKQQIRLIYFIGLILSKVVSKSRMQSMVGNYQLGNQEIQKGISAVIETDKTLNTEITKLKDSECDCENERQFPKICEILAVLVNIFDHLLLFPPSYLLYLITLPFIFPVVILYCFVFNCINIPY